MGKQVLYFDLKRDCYILLRKSEDYSKKSESIGLELIKSVTSLFRTRADIIRYEIATARLAFMRKEMDYLGYNK